MTFYPGYKPHFLSTVVCGLGCTSRGLLTSYSVEDQGGGDVLLEWTHIRPACYSSSGYYFNVHKEGVFTAQVLGQDSALIGGFRSGITYEVDVLPISRMEKDDITTCNLFAVVDKGNRAILTCATPVNNSMTVYNNAGDSGAATVAISSYTMTLVVTGGASASTTTVDLADPLYDTIGKVETYVEGLGLNWVIALTDSENMPSVYLSDLAATGCKGIGNIQTLTATAWDFYSYNIYWDNAREDGTCDTLLKELKGINNNIYTTATLNEGTHSFELKYKDNIGNLSSAGATATATINTYPLTVSGAALSYSGTTDLVTLSWSNPGAQSSDVVGIAIYSNYLIGQGLQEEVCLEKWNRLSFEADTATSWTSWLMSEGNWRFAIRPTDKTGLEAPYTELAVNLAWSGSDLVETDIKPDPPTNMDVTANASGTITITCKHDGTNMDYIYFYQDDAKIYEHITWGTSETTYSHTTGALTNGQEYSFYTKALNGAVLSEESDTVTEVADSAAPAGDLTITTETVF